MSLFLNKSFSTYDTDEMIEKSISEELDKKHQNLLTKRKDKEEEYEIFTVNENFYLSPVRKYLKYKRKKHEYSKIYDENKLKYFSSIPYQFFMKYLRKRLIRSLCSAAIMSAGMYFLCASGLKDKIMEIMQSTFWFIINKIRRNKIN